MSERPQAIACQVCTADVPVGRRGPVPEFCPQCIEVATRLGQFKRAVAAVRTALPPAGQAKLRKYLVSQMISWINAEFNKHRFMHGKPCKDPGYVSDATKEARRAGFAQTTGKSPEQWLHDWHAAGCPYGASACETTALEFEAKFLERT